ncbi:MAG: DUF1343 domain-containing protein [Candidatus Sumerlaeaceae bacterium]|nr:DUF1343 domain-containing protein [Candidatus Sumerlaeaceae bacterium]
MFHHYLTACLTAVTVATAAAGYAVSTDTGTTTPPDGTAKPLPRNAKGPVTDEDFKHLFGDTSVSPERTEAFFQDEFVTTPPAFADLRTTEAVAKLADERARQADAISSASNARWRQSAGKVEPFKARIPGVKVRLGNEVLFDSPELLARLKGKRIGLITNPTGMDSAFVSTIDKLASHPDIKLTALFAPEHGVRGAERAGEKVETRVDERTGVIVYSLHGRDKKGRPQNKPRPSMLENVDVLMYDIQDIGNRSYTYPGTMKLCMQAAAENGKEFWVLDRPNPMGGNLVSGNVADPSYVTLVAWAPVAYLYGLTQGELAGWLNTETGIGCDLTVVPMKGWTRDMKWWDTGLPWIPTSTHMQVPEACWYIALTGTFGELNVINEGVGYPLPFAYFGAPWIDPDRLAAELNREGLPGLVFRPAYFRPYYHVFKDKMCGGVQIHITDYDKVMPVEASMHIIAVINRLYPEQEFLDSGAGADPVKRRNRVAMFNKVMGTNKVRAALKAGKSGAEVSAMWAAERDRYAKEREKYFLYK